MNVPNFITLIRIILVPVMVIFLMEGKDFLAMLTFLAAGIGDGLDGFLARALNQRTKLGAFLDPLADKLLLTTSFIVLAIYDLAPGWLAVLVASRDILIVTGIGILTWNDHFPQLKPTVDSKITTFFQIITLAFLLGHDYTGPVLWLLNPLLACTAVMTVISGIRYIIIGFRTLGDDLEGHGVD